MLGLLPRLRLLRAALGLGVCAAALSAAPPGQAQPQSSASTKAAAEAMFDRGLSLMREGKYAQACRQLESSQALERGIGTMLYLAECYEKLGRIASAWALFREASSAARAAGQDERAAAGAERAQQLEPRLSRLVIEVGEAARVPGLEVRYDDTPSPPASWGAAVPVDPGPHTVAASAPGRAEWSKEIRIAEGTAQTTVSIPSLTPLPPEALAAQSQPTPASTPVAAAGGARINAKADGSTQRIVGLALGGAGVLALGVSTYFGVQAFNKEDEADQLCNGQTLCDSRVGVDRSQEATDAATLSNVFAVGGAAAVTTGVLLYLLAPKASERVSVAAGPSLVDVRFGGAF